MISADHFSLGLQLGSWIDEHRGRYPIAADIHVTGAYGDEAISPVEDIVATMQEWGWVPWRTETKTTHIFAGASGLSVEVIIAALPGLGEVIASGTAKVVAERIASKLMSFFGGAIRSGSLNLEQASNGARDYLLRNVGIALQDLRQTSAEIGDDGSCVLVFHDARNNEDHMVVLSNRGISAHVNLAAIDAFVQRYGGQ